MCQFAHENLLMLFDLLSLSNVVSAIDRARNVSALILKRTDIDNGSDPRSVWPLDDYVLVIDLGYFSGNDPGHGALIVRHECSVRTEHFDRATEPFTVIPACRCAAPQFRGTPIEILDDAPGVTGIDGRGSKFEQSAKALLARA